MIVVVRRARVLSNLPSGSFHTRPGLSAVRVDDIVSISADRTRSTAVNGGDVWKVNDAARWLSRPEQVECQVPGECLT